MGIFDVFFLPKEAIYFYVCELFILRGFTDLLAVGRIYIKRSCIPFMYNLHNYNKIAQLGNGRWYNLQALFRFLQFHICFFVYVCLVLCNFIICMDWHSHHYGQNTQAEAPVLVMLLRLEPWECMYWIQHWNEVYEWPSQAD